MIETFIRFVFYVCVSGLTSNIFGVLYPRRYIKTDSFPFNSFRWENNGRIYEKIYVTKWKKKVPDLSKHLKLLYPKVLNTHPTSKQIDRLIRESCVAEAVHLLLILLCPLITCYIKGVAGKVYMILYALGNVPYIIIQRYNRPKFKSLYSSLLVRENNVCDSLEANVNENIGAFV